jgi:hypothetical protein
MLMMLP